MSNRPKHKQPTCPECRVERIRSYGAARCEACRLRPGWHRGRPPPEDADEPIHVGEAVWANWLRACGFRRNRYRGPKKRRPGERRQKLVAFGDLHVPLHHERAIAALLAREADADLAVIGGDFIDAYSFSTFIKRTRIDWQHEAAAATILLQRFSETWPTIRYLRGSNHPDRFEKRLRERLPRDMLDALEEMTGGVLAPDLAIAHRFPNVEIVGWDSPAGRVDWLTIVGDVAFSHAEKYSRVPGAALRSVQDWLEDFQTTLGLPEISCVVQFHTHAVSWFPWRGRKLLVEPGCLCHVADYMLGSRIAGRPQRLGYVTMDLVDGRVDLNSVRPHCLDWEDLG